MKNFTVKGALGIGIAERWMIVPSRISGYAALGDEDTTMSKAEIKLSFGVDRTNRVVHISDVESGRACDCTCPGCGVPLEAVKGQVRQHHFRHAVEVECEGAAESAIHRAAKQMLRERKQLNLPEHRVEAPFLDSQGVRHIAEEILVGPRKVAKFDSVEEEVGLHGMRADLLAVEGNRPLMIEIRFSHPVDEEKRAKIVAAGVSAIEIDLSDLLGEKIVDWSAFWALINDRSRMIWLHNAKEAQAHEELRNRLPALKAARDEEYQYREQTGLKKALAEMRFYRSAAHLGKLRAGAENHFIWRDHVPSLRLKFDELPTFVNSSVPNGDWIYKCDRRLWQLAIYSYWIVRKRKSFSSAYLDNWLQESLGFWVPGCVKIIADYGPKYPDLIQAGDRKDLPSTLKTLNAYCEVLCEAGILRLSGRDRNTPGSFWYSVQKIEPITSSNERAA